MSGQLVNHFSKDKPIRPFFTSHFSLFINIGNRTCNVLLWREMLGVLANASGSSFKPLGWKNIQSKQISNASEYISYHSFLNLKILTLRWRLNKYFLSTKQSRWQVEHCADTRYWKPLWKVIFADWKTSLKNTTPYMRTGYVRVTDLFKFGFPVCTVCHRIYTGFTGIRPPRFTGC